MGEKTKTRSIKNLSEYLEAVFDFSDEDDALFRGHRCANWDLEPSIGRLRLRTDDSLLAVEAKLIEAFKRQCLPHLARDLQDEWDVVAMAQHHGLATRLLDWTGNPLAALWFAVREPAIRRERGVVLMFQPESADYIGDDRSRSPYTIRKTRFFQPSHLNARIVAQSGWFSVHAWNSGRKAFNRLERLSHYRNRVERVMIPAPHFADIRLQLDRLGVNEASLFPGLDGISRHLNWLHTVLPDEGSD